MEKKNYGREILAFFLILIAVQWLVAYGTFATLLSFFGTWLVIAYFDDFMDRLDIWMRMRELG